MARKNDTEAVETFEGELVVEVTEMEIALTTRDLTRALVGYVSDAIHREND